MVVQPAARIVLVRPVEIVVGATAVVLGGSAVSLAVAGWATAAYLGGLSLSGSP